jgi:hypothetical protein
MSSNRPIDSLFASLWSDYVAFNPGAKKIYDAILERERTTDPSVKELVNDHVALRTYNVPHMGLEAMASLFTKQGYFKGGEYVFEEKKLRAWHFEHEDTRLPKVFISELEIEKLSPLVQETARAVAASISPDAVKKDSFLWSRRNWTASHATYQKLLAESEYAAWMYAFGFRSNHFTISFNHLKSFKDLKALNEFVTSIGFPLNQSGGEIKGTPAVFLEQSSTLAEKARVEFTDGTFEIPACYYEFARRYPMPNGKIYQGFVATSADKIFESTNVKR